MLNVPYTGFEKLDIGIPNAIRDDLASLMIDYVPPHLSGEPATSTNETVESSWNRQSKKPYTTDEVKSQSFISNPYGSSQPASSADTPWSTTDNRRRPGVEYNAYGPNGEVARRISSQPATSTPAVAVRANNKAWAKPVSRLS